MQCSMHGVTHTRNVSNSDKPFLSSHTSIYEYIIIIIIIIISVIIIFVINIYLFI